ncbi:hypothetical protein FA15DRAFT_671163 [Coprinopsis marcescibilis]|uniref:Uncharacterized protein n=1 Tax=Coprinopsis marcescibilis TaxID=230819 RepID=A0A5C3KQB0_COPMA|nr:hypothetical protein FA15DRAFT_671163 [Coprinopsis marcescibilis]
MLTEPVYANQTEKGLGVSFLESLFGFHWLVGLTHSRSYRTTVTALTTRKCDELPCIAW